MTPHEPWARLLHLWDHGQQQTVKAFLASAGELTAAELVAVLDVDQWQRWRHGDRVPTEEYLRDHPCLAADPEHGFQLVYGEWLLRERHGERPTQEEFARRFPAYADRLRLQLELHGAVAPTSGDATPSADTDEPRRPHVPGYEVLEEIGRGGMGVVYRAKQLGLNRVVALKVMRAGAVLEAEWRARFRAEAEAVARQQHPNVVQIFEVGETDGVPFLALEYVAGGSLERHIAGRPQPARTSAELLETLARAVHFIHGQGIIHRDLKPANVLLASGGREKVPGTVSAAETVPGTFSRPPLAGLVPKLTDFGLAKRLDASAVTTAAGAVVGTPSYMAPEQATAQPNGVGPPADVYSLGAILYECLTGRPPFQGETSFDVLRQVLATDPVPLRRLLPQVPRDLETICLRCLRKEPARRYPSAEALADDLKRFRDGRPILARPVGVSERVLLWTRRRPALAALLVAVAVTSALGIAATVWQAREAERARLDAALQRGRTEAAEELAEERRRGDYFGTLAFAEQAWTAGDVSRFNQLLDACPTDLRNWEWRFHRHRNRDAREVLDAAGPVNAVALSPDGLLLAAGCGDSNQQLPGTITIWERNGKSFPLTGHTGPVSGVAFAPDGKTLYSVSTSINLVKAIQEDRRVFNRPGGELIVWSTTTWKPIRTLPNVYGTLTLSADGKRLAVAVTGRGAVIWDTATPTWSEIATVARPGGIGGIALSADGKRVAVADVHFLAATGTPVKYEHHFGIFDAENGREVRSLPSVTEVNSAAFSPDGKQLAAVGGDRIVRVWDVDREGPPRHFLGHSTSLLGVTFSADGALLATTANDGIVKIWDAATGADRRTLRGHKGPARTVQFYLRDRETRLLSGGRDGVVRQWDPEDGPGFTSVRNLAGQVTKVAFAADGLLAIRFGYGTVRVWDTAAAKERYTLQSNCECLAVSPDGQTLVTGELSPHGLDQPGPIKFWDVKTGELRRTLPGGSRAALSVAFSADGKTLASSSGIPIQPPIPGEVTLWDVETGSALRSFRPPIGCVMSVAFSPDGRRLVAGSLNDAVAVCDTTTGSTLHELRDIKGSIMSVAYSPDGWALATGGDDAVILWDGESLARRHTLPTLGPVFGLAFTPDGSRLATATFDLVVRFRGEVKLWDTRTGREALRLPGQWTVALSPDGVRLAAAAPGSSLEPGEVRVWEAP